MVIFCKTDTNWIFQPKPFVFLGKAFLQRLCWVLENGLSLDLSSQFKFYLLSECCSCCWCREINPKRKKRRCPSRHIGCCWKLSSWIKLYNTQILGSIPNWASNQVQNHWLVIKVENRVQDRRRRLLLCSQIYRVWLHSRAIALKHHGTQFTNAEEIWSFNL